MEHEGKDKFGRYFEEFKVGDIYKHWPGKTITEGDNFLFCGLTMNSNPLHIDAHYMTKHQHGRILVAGTYILSLAVGISVPDTSGKAIANLEFERITHDAPVFAGDTIYAESEVLEVRESQSRRDRGLVQVETKVHNQDGVKVLTLRRRFMVPKKH